MQSAGAHDAGIRDGGSQWHSRQGKPKDCNEVVLRRTQHTLDLYSAPKRYNKYIYYIFIFLFDILLIFFYPLFAKAFAHEDEVDHTSVMNTSRDDAKNCHRENHRVTFKQEGEHSEAKWLKPPQASRSLSKAPPSRSTSVALMRTTSAGNCKSKSHKDSKVTLEANLLRS